MIKETLKSTLSFLQKIGKALMLPVSVLPIAGLLLGVGSAHFSWLPELVSNVMVGAGDSIFGNLPLLFAISVTLGLTSNDGVAGFSSVVSYAVMLSTMGIIAKVIGVPTKSMMGIDTINTGVAGGILMGSITASLYNKYQNIELPPYLGFFGGKRFIPIVSSLAAIVFGLILSFVWPPIGNGIQSFSIWASHENPALAFTLYGIGERSLIPFGLHHILNAPFFFETGSYIDPATGKTITGEIQRYLYGDPTAGNLAGGYLFKMWGLCGAALAMWHVAKPENKKRVGGVMIAAALTSFITGITEPIEFAFLFVAPILYAAHALIAGFSFFVCIALGIKHGTTFSHGLIDFIVLYPKSTNAWMLWILGPIWAVMYFAVFTYIIKKFNLKTPGREDEVYQVTIPPTGSQDSFSESLAVAFGGASNIKSLDSCITRLRVQLNSTKDINPEDFKRLGATNSIVMGNGIQVIFGTRSENIKNQLEQYLKNPAPMSFKTSSENHPVVLIKNSQLVQLFGGFEN
ncbi:MAG: PTS glucose transporter subunit IIBC, partial [Moraxellaceae bacterium]|nr:PTS glucose transporter subunit IIBC [Pseudobdellovibrionaceae bacterium]